MEFTSKRRWRNRLAIMVLAVAAGSLVPTGPVAARPAGSGGGGPASAQIHPAAQLEGAISAGDVYLALIIAATVLIAVSILGSQLRSSSRSAGGPESVYPDPSEAS